MSFFKWLDNHIRESNEKWHQSYRAGEEEKQRREEAKQQYLDSLDCCANCLWYKYRDYSGNKYICTKHDFCFDEFEVKYHDIHHEKTCAQFRRR